MDKYKLACMYTNASRLHLAGITNYTYFRWSTTGSHQVSMAIFNATDRPGNEVRFRADWCQPPDPNPDLLGCVNTNDSLLVFEIS